MDVVFWVAVKSEDTEISKKHGNFDYFEYSKYTWEYWCKKNGVHFYEYAQTDYDTNVHKITWTRWFDVFSKLDETGINYKKVAVIDASTMIRWDTPNFFNKVNNNLKAFQSLENIKWIDEGIKGYQPLFPDTKFDLKKYISCGFQIFNKTHKPFLKELKEFYFNNLNTILSLQSTIGRGTDQPIYNYLLQKNNIEVDCNLPASYWLMHMNRFNWFAHNWQLKEDQMPYFIKYGYIWVFSGFDRRQRYGLMEQTWNMVKNNYNG